ncbi:MAG: aldo/keto reductase [Planctomycetes bacterium]|nr:aldo/keto reductase [Planctomycetota bacterium]
MKYNRLGRAGLKLSELSFGAWITFGAQLDVAAVKKSMRLAFERGVNFFDNAEAYGGGAAERLMGAALKDFKRSDVVVSTKIFWGGKGPNDKGLNRKHLIEGTYAALERLDLDYVDLLYCHRPDPETPIDETVRAMDFLIRAGHAFYWGTSEWSAAEIERAHEVARELGCVPPSMEQPEYNLLHRERVEKEYLPLYARYGMGTTTWSPLASGILSGKYDHGFPKGSRLDRVEWLRESLTPDKVEKTRALGAIARGLGCTTAQLSIAWCLKNPHVSSVILGASSERQLEENLAAAEVRDRLDDAVLAEIDAAVR